MAADDDARELIISNHGIGKQIDIWINNAYVVSVITILYHYGSNESTLLLRYPEAGSIYTSRV